MRPVLVGISDPYDREALAPEPVGCTGWRIWRMLHLRCGITPVQYRQIFRRMNLDKMEPIRRGSTVVVLGDKVREHFCLPKAPFSRIERNGISYWQIPHPSGLNRDYNDPDVREASTDVLERVMVQEGERNGSRKD